MNEVSKYVDWLISFGKSAKLLPFLVKNSDFTCFLGCGSVRGILPNWKLYSNRSLWPNLSNESNFEFGKIPWAEIPKLYFVYNLEFWPQLNSAAVAQSVERQSAVWMVVGSNPGGGATFFSFFSQSSLSDYSTLQYNIWLYLAKNTIFLLFWSFWRVTISTLVTVSCYHSLMIHANVLQMITSY